MVRSPSCRDSSKSTVHDRYLLEHPQTRLVVETPQHFFLRIAGALSDTG
jgi:ribonucleoside-diphosphate reductase alpha chain